MAGWGSAEPAPGMIIFFDWADESGQDGLSDHTGIVGKVRKRQGLYGRGQLRRQLPSQWVFYRLLRDSWLRRTCLLKYTSRLHFAGGWITYVNCNLRFHTHISDWFKKLIVMSAKEGYGFSFTNSRDWLDCWSLFCYAFDFWRLERSYQSKFLTYEDRLVIAQLLQECLLWSYRK